jgi:hypothetical protein
MVRTEGTGWARRWFCLLLGLNQGKDLNILPAKVERSRCAEALDLPHLPNALVPERWAFAQRWQEEVTDGELRLFRRARSPLAAFRQALLPQSTALTIDLIGQIDSPLGESIFLPHFAQPQACPCGTA